MIPRRGFATIGLAAFGLAAIGAVLVRPESARAADKLQIAAAVTLKPALDEIAAAYDRQDDRQGGSSVAMIYGPTPALAKQIENGLPADLFFSADQDWVVALEHEGLVDPASVADIVGNHLVVIGHAGSDMPETLTSSLPLASLLGDGRLAMCDPDSHPAGRYAKAGLVKLGLWQSVETRIARAENPLLAVQMVARGDVPFAIVFTTDARTDRRVRIVGTFPDDSHPPIRYPIAPIMRGQQAEAAKFVAFLRSGPATAVFQRLGYVVLDRQR